MFVVGLAAALVASAMFNLGAALQALEARAQPKRLELRLTLVGRLLRRPLWLLGFALGLVGIAPQVLALATAPFVVVQPALVVGLLLVLAIGARVLGEHVTVSAWAGAVAIVAGVALIAAVAPEHTETHRGGLAVVAVVAGLGLPSLLPFVVRHTRLDTAWHVMIASGLGFAATNVATKLMSDDVGRSEWANAAAWGLAGLALAVAATVTNMTAFQRRPASVAVPVTTAIQTFLPIVLEPLFLREHWGASPLRLGAIAGGVAVTAAGTVLVGRARGVGKLIAQR
jgi:drug/metabolite transporter (DMT)-like permease